MQDYAADFAKTKIIPALDRSILKSDHLLTSAIRDDLSKAVAQLEQDPSNTIPMSADPDGVSRVVIGMPQDSNGPSNGSLKGRRCYAMTHAWSLRYQWLPFEVKFVAEKPATRIASYINNVHPVRHAAFYSVLERVIDKTIPLFDECLTSIETPSRFYKTRIDVECPDYGDIPNLEPGEYQTLEARTQWQYLRNKSRERPSVNLRKDFADLGLQFIVEASSINLDPLLQYWDPHAWDWDGDANGSRCNVRGQLNERICATVLYFYDCDDLHQGLLGFEQRVSNDEPKELNSLCETRETEEVYCIQDGEARIQQIGNVYIRQGRTIAFPNVFVLFALQVPLSRDS
ncbi:MAG: hypothetical protein Q9194_002111 [Teloschistes cf. exilis]